MHFTEKQYFKQIWLWAILLIIMATSILPILSSEKMEPIHVLIFVSPTLLIMILFFIMNLKTTINQKSLSIQFFPFIRKPKVFFWSDIQKVELKKYNALTEYGGWGIRGLSDDKAYNIQGNIGLKIYFKNNTKLMIGTQNPEKISRIVSQICKQEKISFHNSLT